MASRTVPVPCDDAGSMPLHVWVPEGGSGPGILLIQEIFGVGPYIRAVAQRLADAGYVVGAPEVFWRFAPGWEAGHDQAGLGRRSPRSANSTRRSRRPTAPAPSAGWPGSTR
ncbi:MAG: dienelactone hydrolase family protein [Ilumatobacteraceae bacterium]